MKWVIIFLFSMSLAKAQSVPQIVGGVNVAENEAPFMVSLQDNSYGHFCGGSLISPDTVLTAAHCVDGGVDFVYIGLLDQKNPDSAEKRSIKKIIVHPEYSGDSHDFAVLKLNKPSKITPIRLTDIEPTTGNVTVYGWGDTRENGSMSNLLLKVTVPVVPRSECKKSYPGQIDTTMICAGLKEGGKDSCQGDSGGALLYRGRLAGVVSWGRGCARPTYYGVYSNIAMDLFWINTQL